MFKLSGMLENSVTKVGGAETWKSGPIELFDDFRTRSLASTQTAFGAFVAWVGESTLEMPVTRPHVWPLSFVCFLEKEVVASCSC